MFERFTDGARLVVRLAQEEARRSRDPFIGTEHLLVAVLDEGHGPAAQALSERGLDVADLRRRIAGLAGSPEGGLDPDALAILGIDLDEVRRATEASFGPGALEAKGRKPVNNGHIPFSKRAKKVLELSLREALRLGHNHIGTGHILLGLLREGEGLAARALVDAGVDLADLRDDVTRLLPSKAA
ncbi:MAG: Clp protease [Actinoallomurus sp.]|nr:Clp protease [Actinoallomurus sp.]